MTSAFSMAASRSLKMETVSGKETATGLSRRRCRLSKSAFAGSWLQRDTCRPLDPYSQASVAPHVPAPKTAIQLSAVAGNAPDAMGIYVSFQPVALHIV